LRAERYGKSSHTASPGLSSRTRTKPSAPSAGSPSSIGRPSAAGSRPGSPRRPWRAAIWTSTAACSPPILLARIWPSRSKNTRMVDLAPSLDAPIELGEIDEPRVPSRLYALKDRDTFIVADGFGDI